ncbi:response regulator [Rhodospirillaceae bacterium SYSU D60014]|uniref:response regulator n=1 Tax=Virgifigura deserti TaxID=2268457 RepID=UPI000E66D5EE
MARPALTGRRVLIVEDQAILAFEVQALLQQLGCEVIGPVGTLEQALDAARTEQLDGAILDVNLDGEPAYLVADILLARQVPVLFATGYGIESLPDRFLDCPILEKPFIFEDLKRLATRLWATA